MSKFRKDTLEFLEGCSLSDKDTVMDILRQEELFDMSDIEYLAFEPPNIIFPMDECETFTNIINDYEEFKKKEDNKTIVDSKSSIIESRTTYRNKRLNWHGNQDLLVNSQTEKPDNLPPLLSSLNINDHDKLQLFRALKQKSFKNFSSSDIYLLKNLQNCDFDQLVNQKETHNETVENSVHFTLLDYITLLRTLLSISELAQGIKIKSRKIISDSPKIRFADPVYTSIDFDGWIVDNVIDTPHFQRLRDLYKLGLVRYVYPNATHSRFAHSLGVAHLSKMHLENLARMRNYSLELDEISKLAKCIQIASLCKDIGKLPFNHAYKEFLNRKDAINDFNTWNLKDFTVELLYDIFQYDNRTSEITEEDLKFIMIIIQGVPPKFKFEDKYDGLIRASMDILANPISGMDVDKIDSIRRDSIHTLGYDPLPPTSRILEKTSIINQEIVYNAQSLQDIWAIYSTRYNLFKKVYAHKKVRSMELMLIEAMEKTNDIFGFDEPRAMCSVDGRDKSYDPSTLTDQSILYQFRTKNDRDLTHEQLKQLYEARKLIFTLQRQPKNIYKFVSEVNLKNHEAIQEKTVLKSKITSENIARYLNPNDRIKADDIIVDWNNFDYGTNNINPLDCVRFYSSEDENKSYTLSEDEKALYPNRLLEHQIRIYVKNFENSEPVTLAFEKFCEKNSIGHSK